VVTFENSVGINRPPQEVAATSKGPLAPTFSFTFEPVDGATRFTRKGDIRIGGAMRLMGPMMRGQAAKRAQGFLQNLKTILEAQPAGGISR
jgi:carbon monoxide dehydrogenase subunit G